MSLDYSVPENKRLRVIIDTDAACEADDPFAIAHALMSKKLEVKAISAEQFGSPESTKRSYDEIMTVLNAMSMSVIHGSSSHRAGCHDSPKRYGLMYVDPFRGISTWRGGCPPGRPTA